LWRSNAIAVAVVLAVAGCSAGNRPGGDDSLRGKSVTVAWAGDDETAFQNMVQPWERQTGATVRYVGTADINATLSGADLPDLAGLPGPGQLAQYAAAGKLVPLDDVLDLPAYRAQTAPALVGLGTVDGKLYGVFLEASIKGLIWFNPSVHDYRADPPKTWPDLLHESVANRHALWCLGIDEPGPAAGWPATDWIEDLVLRTAGPQVYTQWYQGKVRWTDPAIRAAFHMYLTDVVARSYGGGQAAVSTYFGNAGNPLFTNPPGCAFLHQASFITRSGSFAAHRAGTDYDFFPFPSIDPRYSGALSGGGVPFGLVHNTPAARSLIRYLVTAQAQNIWIGKGGVLSANKHATSYPDETSRRLAAILAGATSFVFDASDSMPAAMSAAFCSGLVALTGGAKSVDQVLSDLDAVQQTAYR
jgi:alpha-glucoside transport system substrate-binding protein